MVWRAIFVACRRIFSGSGADGRNVVREVVCLGLVVVVVGPIWTRCLVGVLRLVACVMMGGSVFVIGRVATLVGQVEEVASVVGSGGVGRVGWVWLVAR